MELEDQKQMEWEKQQTRRCLNQIIYWEGQIIGAHNDYMKKKGECERQIRDMYEQIARSKRMKLLKQQGLKWSYSAEDLVCREESEKELQRWKNLAPGEKIEEHREEISKLENDEDWEPMTDIQVDRWIEKETEKELERLEKQEKERQEKERERKEVRQMRSNIN